SCLSDSDCPQASTVGVGVCPRNCVGGSTPGATCTADGDCGGGTCPVGACIPQVCAPSLTCPSNQTCTPGGPGSAVVISSTAIGTVQPPIGAKPNVCNVRVAPTPGPGTAGYGPR